MKSAHLLSSTFFGRNLDKKKLVCQVAVMGANARRPCVASQRSGGLEVRSPSDIKVDLNFEDL